MPQSEDEIAQKLARLFVGVTADEIVADVAEFLQELARYGFVGCGQGEITYPVFFSYADRSPKTLQNEGEEKLPGEEGFYEK